MKVYSHPSIPREVTWLLPAGVTMEGAKLEFEVAPRPGAFLRAFEGEAESARLEALANLEKCWWGNEEPIAYILARCVRSPRAAFVAWLLNRP